YEAGLLCVSVFDNLTARATLTWSLLAPPKQYKSCEGIFVSLCAVILFCISLFSYLVFLRYQIYYGYPLETYLEYPIIIAQGNFCKPCFGNEMGLIQYWGSWYMLTLQKWIIDLAMNMCTFISAASKVVQLQHLWQTKDSGQASALTWGMSVYTCAGKLQRGT
uniref:Solute carrier family 66 member 3 n=1 Tax=Zosterops lateralis melanops TaxID=1220523 RepID=A0A8D2PRI8_ZOSLA